MRRAGTEVATALDGAPDRAELTVERRGETILLLSPGVGLFAAARPEGDLLAPGADAGVLLALGRTIRLEVPPGVEGRVVPHGRTPSGEAKRGAPGIAPRRESAAMQTARAPQLSRRPVGWGDVLYEVRAMAAPSSHQTGASVAGVEPGATVKESGRLLLLSPQSGRFYQRPGPDQEPFVAAGAIVEEGQPIGLIEVMKTFAHVRYTSAGGLPRRAVVASVLVQDGAEVAAGDPLLELAPISAS